MTETLLTVREVARRLAVGRTVVYELLARGGLQSIKIGRARRIPASALDEWIARQLRAQGDETWETAAIARDQSTKPRKANGDSAFSSARGNGRTSPPRRARK